MATMLKHTEQSGPVASKSLAPAEPVSPLTERFCVGDWQVCPELNRLQRRQGQLQRQLEPRLIHLLCYLAANADRVLNRDELVQELWPRVVVNENSLTRAMSELRKHLALSDRPGRAYIETIPKKGYRLLPAVETVSEDEVASLPKAHFLKNWMTDWQLPARHALVAMSLSLLLGAWLGMTPVSQLVNPSIDTTLLADEVINSTKSTYGGEFTLSTTGDTGALPNGIKSVEAPVISNDESQYAYIQHDNSGSTIFLGRLDALAAPVVAVYNSPDKLFNLTWSPLGHNLMFARQSKLTTAALFSDDRNSAELIMLDLTTMEAQRMAPEANPSPAETSKPQNLT